MSISAEVIWTDVCDETRKVVEKKRFTIEGETLDDVLSTYFREYVNRYKYWHGRGFKFTNPEYQEAFKVWHSNPGNCARNGANMD